MNLISELEVVLRDLHPDQKINTVSWVLLAVSDGLPRNDSYPQILGRFVAGFLANKVGVDPNADPNVIKTKLAAWAKTSPPSLQITTKILDILKSHKNMTEAITALAVAAKMDDFGG